MTGYPKEFYSDLEGTALPSARRIVPILVDLIAPAAVVDFGCGDGSWLSVFRDHGATRILGLDGDTPEVFGDVLQFVRESGLYEVQITFMTAFPGTPLYARLKADGRVLRDRAWELCTLFDINFQPKNMSVAELQNG